MKISPRRFFIDASLHLTAIAAVTVIFGAAALKDDARAAAAQDQGPAIAALGAGR